MVLVGVIALVMCIRCGDTISNGTAQMCCTKSYINGRLMNTPMDSFVQASILLCYWQLDMSKSHPKPCIHSPEGRVH
uniref:Secreted protein n=1 Tax=Panagrellus redivivus TaxID=6233 RepID=A0A7E4URU0_PANRE